MDVPPLVDGRGHNVEQLFGGKTYNLGYFQREYVWERKQIEKLMSDLFGRFESQYREQHERSAVSYYETYFLGPFVTYEERGMKFLADGQQRFTTLLMLLIYIRQLLVEQDETAVANAVDRAITSTRFGVLTFTVDVIEYRSCLDAFYNGREFDAQSESANVQRLWDACSLIASLFPTKLRGEALPFLADWLLYRVSLVEITAGGAKRAWEVFERMNDRGKQLTSMDLLRGYLLNQSPESEREDLRGRWQRMVAKLDQRERELSSEYIQALIRAKYVTVDADGAPDAEDLELVENAAHEWVRHNERKIWPQPRDGDCGRLIRQVVAPLGGLYASLAKATVNPQKGFEAILFNARNSLIRQFDLTLAAAQTTDSSAVLLEKARLVANFADSVVVRLRLGNRGFEQADFDQVAYGILPHVRHTTTLRELASVLETALVDIEGDFSGFETLRLRADNGAFIRYLLARLTAWLEVGAERVDPVLHYLAEASGGPTHQIEHLWPNRYDLYKEDASSELDFQILRGRLGALVLLNAGENAGMGGAALADKLSWYRGQNLLAASLSGISGRGSAKFKQFARKQGLTDMFSPFAGGMEVFIAQRARLYRAMAEQIWGASHSPSKSTAAHISGGDADGRRRRRYGVEFDQLVVSGRVPTGTLLMGTRRGVQHTAIVLDSGLIRTASGGMFDSPSAAAMDALNGGSANGWTFWHAELDGRHVRLDRIRRDFM